MPYTSLGREVAVQKLAERREEAQKQKVIVNSSLPAGSPMYYPCLGCGIYIRVPEDWISKPDLCDECSALQKLGWLE